MINHIPRSCCHLCSLSLPLSLTHNIIPPFLPHTHNHILTHSLPHSYYCPPFFPLMYRMSTKVTPLRFRSCLKSRTVRPSCLSTISHPFSLPSPSRPSKSTKVVDCSVNSCSQTVVRLLWKRKAEDRLSLKRFVPHIE